MPLTKINLKLLEQKLSSLGDTPYFSSELKLYTKQLSNVARKADAITDPQVRNRMVLQLWSAIKYLDGSTTRLLPYEVVFCLDAALKDWTTDNYLITTAILHEMNFYFQGISPSFYTEAEGFCGETFEYKLIQVALPDLYRHRPLYNVALYHELGHFIDTHKAISDYLLLLSPNVQLPRLSAGVDEKIRRNHVMEYWADIFAASYLGYGIHKFLDRFAHNVPVSATHPATSDRLELIEAFLDGKSMPILDGFQAVLSQRNLGKLEIRFDSLDVKEYFDNVMPCPISNIGQLHALFDSSWDYLETAQQRLAEPWSLIREDQIEKMINDLSEKSIRNFMISQRWGNGTP
ncbi:M48 family metalloprotease [Micavibrio aeruginosavorus]|uniref:Uncharacterized protein n=1 Tax=Micavibrio aeruginosavorus EPB TaxID=349215 RepID=M4VM19_9BACT|nr:hypothetical protein [Micavibrio aeruginosavorus]AGH99181.1 hypothetical protein A11S_2387 [Micavibrio aeruginosavorus EPB]